VPLVVGNLARGKADHVAKGHHPLRPAMVVHPFAGDARLRIGRAWPQVAHLDGPDSCGSQIAEALLRCEKGRGVDDDGSPLRVAGNGGLCEAHGDEANTFGVHVGNQLAWVGEPGRSHASGRDQQGHSQAEGRDSTQHRVLPDGHGILLTRSSLAPLYIPYFKPLFAFCKMSVKPT